MSQPDEIWGRIARGVIAVWPHEQPQPVVVADFRIPTALLRLSLVCKAMRRAILWEVYGHVCVSTSQLPRFMSLADTGFKLPTHTLVLPVRLEDDLFQVIMHSFQRLVSLSLVHLVRAASPWNDDTVAPFVASAFVVASQLVELERFAITMNLPYRPYYRPLDLSALREITARLRLRSLVLSIYEQGGVVLPVTLPPNVTDLEVTPMMFDALFQDQTIIPASLPRLSIRAVQADDITWLARGPDFRAGRSESNLSPSNLYVPASRYGITPALRALSDHGTRITYLTLDDIVFSYVDGIMLRGFQSLSRLDLSPLEWLNWPVPALSDLYDDAELGLSDIPRGPDNEDDSRFFLGPMDAACTLRFMQDVVPGFTWLRVLHVGRAETLTRGRYSHASEFWHTAWGLTSKNVLLTVIGIGRCGFSSASQHVGVHRHRECWACHSRQGFRTVRRRPSGPQERQKEV